MLFWLLLDALGLLRATWWPAANEVFSAARSMQPPLAKQAAMTLGLIVSGFLTGIILSWALGCAMLLSRTAATLIGPITDVLRGVPPVCFIPFFILWFGFAPTGKVALIAVNVLLVVYPVFVAHFRSLDRTYEEVWASFGRSNAAFVIGDGIRATATAMIPTYRFALSFAVMLAIIAEAMGATAGLGHVITVALSTFSLGSLVAASIAAAALAAILDVLLVLTCRFLFPWVRWGDASQLS